MCSSDDGKLCSTRFRSVGMVSFLSFSFPPFLVVWLGSGVHLAILKCKILLKAENVFPSIHEMVFHPIK